jgi:hypothetical protein
MRRCLAAALFSLLLATTVAFGQTGNGQVFGSVQDSSKALMPGVTITITNKNTGVTDTRVSNDSGAYTFPSVPPGSYKITAELPGFKVAAADNLEVGAGAQLRWNFSMEVGTVTNQVEVTIAADQVITETSNSVGTVLTQQRMTDIPLVGQNVLDVLQTLPGFRQSLDGNDSHSTVGGMSLDTVNTTVNGLTTVSSRDSASLWGRQTMTTAVVNPDMVGEMKLITTPVDAELGRGNAQVQIQTRSGTNRFAGSGVWNIQNSALNANSWFNNSNVGGAIKPNWYNLNQLTGSLGGPIVRNKTFFFFLYDKQLINRRTLVNSSVLSDAARQGIWRYWEGWNPATAGTPNPVTFASAGATPTGSIAAVDIFGNPVAPAFNPTGGAYTLGGLRCFSIFGNVKVDGSAFGQADCPGGTAVSNPTPWDSLRPTVDQTGLIKNILGIMPRANFFSNTGATGTDGLNLATYRYLQRTHGPDPGSINADIGVASSELDLNERNQFNAKIDHNFNQKHRASVTWTYERTGGETALAGWGTGLNGDVRRRPYLIIANFTSTLSPTLLNEARFGLNYSNEFATSPWDNLDNASIAAKAQQYIFFGGTNSKNGKKYPILFNPGTGWNGYMFPASGQFGFDFGNLTPLWDYSDTLRWTHGKHSISAGGEYRLPGTTGYNNSPYVGAAIGNASGSTPQFFSNTNLSAGAAQLPNFLATTRGNAGTLLNTVNGAIVAPNTGYWINGQADITNGTWQDVTTADNTIPSADKYGHQTRKQIQQEYSFFVKDDFKITPRLTLNIGIRWDLDRSPYFTGQNKGLTNRFAGDGLGLFGAGRPSGSDPFKGWLTPGNLYLSGYGTNATNPLACVQGSSNPNGIPNSSCDPSLMSTVIFVGPGTNHSNQSLVPESGRFGPAIGAAWQLPWFGEGKTTIRGGYQRTNGQAASLFTGGLLSGPGADGSSSTNLSNPAINTILASRALNLSDLPLLVPAPPVRAPKTLALPVGARLYNSTYGMYSPNYYTPYTDNYTLTITRQLTRNMTLELRSINTKANGYGPSVSNAATTGGGGSFGTAGTFDINTANVYHNPELLSALNNARAGIDDPFWDQMLMGLNLNPTTAGYGPVGTVVGGVLQRGAAQLRRSAATGGVGQPAIASALANGNYPAVISALLAANTTSGLQTLPVDPSTGLLLTTSQRVLRNGCDRLANGLTSGFTDPNTGNQVLPRCFPENFLVANPQLQTAEYANNLGYTSYHAFEAQYTLRPTFGTTLQATYGFSKTMAQPGSNFTDPLAPKLDYGRTAGSVGSDFRMNGTAELPIGPNRLLLADSHGVLARAVEHWQAGFIYQISEGAPRSFLTGNGLTYNNNRPNIVGPWKNPKGSVTWNGNTGYFFGNTQYATFQDPQCANVTTKDNLQANCSLVALAQVAAQGTAGAIPVSQGRYGIPVLANPQPGQQGNLGNLTMATFPRWALDGNLSKTLQISERKSVVIRFDATNILNHATPSDPVGLGNTGSSFQNALGFGFGNIVTTSPTAPAKTGQNGSTLGRTFQAKVRFNF